MPSATAPSATWVNHRLDGAAGTASIGRAKLTSQQPEATATSRRHRQNCSHSNQEHAANILQSPEMSEKHWTHIIRVHNFIIYMPGEVVLVHVFTSIL